jgi:hypothetical protein
MQLITWATLLPLALAAPVLQPRGLTTQLIPDNYIVKLKDGSSESTLQNTIKQLQSGHAKHVYRAGRFKGFAAKLTPKLLDAVSKLPEVCPYPFFSFLGWCVLTVPG